MSVCPADSVTWYTNISHFKWLADFYMSCYINSPLSLPAKPTWAIRILPCDNISCVYSQEIFILPCVWKSQLSAVNHANKTILTQTLWKHHWLFLSSPALMLSNAEGCFLSLMIQLLGDYWRAELCPFSLSSLQFKLLLWQSLHIVLQLFIHNKGLYKISSGLEEMSHCRCYEDAEEFV